MRAYRYMSIPFSTGARIPVHAKGGGGSKPSTLVRMRQLLQPLSALACLVWFALSLGGVPAQAAEPMTFQVQPIGAVNGVCGRKCAEVISAEGEITNDTADAFLAFLTSHVQEQGLRPVILLESPGGTVVGSMQLGMAFRKIGAAVIVAQAVDDAGQVRVAPGLCMSACVYALFGGKKRVIPSVSRIGIHRMVINDYNRDWMGSVTRQQTFGTDEIVSTLSAYAKMMGVDPSVVAFAEQVPPENIHIVTPREITRWRLGSPRL